jgi:predicted 2-oxoglutarate/Fe(II)-dependent dioxygenase YbiX
MGGDFSFFNGNYKIKLGCGDALIFPAGLHWVHGVEKITSGNRYSTNSFLQPAPAWVEERAVNYLNEMVSKTDMQKNRYKIEE